MECVIFAAIGVLGLGLNKVIMWFVREKTYLHYMIAKAIIAGIVLSLNFGARRSLPFLNVRRQVSR
jgi:putative flippase GtrA